MRRASRSTLALANLSVPSLGKFSDLETTAYADAELLRQTLLKPWEDRVEKSIVRLRSQMDDRDDDEALEIEDLEFEFNKAGHGLVAQAVFDDIETTTDVLNGCKSLACTRYAGG